MFLTGYPGFPRCTYYPQFDVFQHFKKNITSKNIESGYYVVIDQETQCIKFQTYILNIADYIMQLESSIIPEDEGLFKNISELIYKIVREKVQIEEEGFPNFENKFLAKL